MRLRCWRTIRPFHDHSSRRRTPMTKLALRLCAALALLACASWAHAAFHLFRIDQIYSNADGSVQFVVLKECCNTNGENQWDGHPLRSTSPAARRRSISRATCRAAPRPIATCSWPRRDLPPSGIVTAGLHHAGQLRPGRRRQPQLCRREPGVVRAAAHRRHECHPRHGPGGAERGHQLHGPIGERAGGGASRPPSRWSSTTPRSITTS